MRPRHEAWRGAELHTVDGGFVPVEPPLVAETEERLTFGHRFLRFRLSEHRRMRAGDPPAQGN